jgi:hypothetical protein
MGNQAIVEICTIIISLIGAVITYMVIPYIRSKTSAQQQENIKFWVNVAVDAAEQIFLNPKMGTTKKEYVLKFLKEKGFNVSETDLDTLIEAAVLELNKLKMLSEDIQI